MNSRLPLLLLSVMASAGCTVGPEPRTASPESLGVPARFQSSSAPQTANAADLADWWDTFDDPVLTLLVEQALGANSNIDAAGARVTPEIYVIDKEGKLAYHGAPDDRAGPTSTPTAFYLKDALDALTAGKAVEKPTVKAWGCGIKRAG